MYYNDTDHARNLLVRDAIVYCDAFGQTIRLTQEDFENEEEFMKWKNISDSDYHKTEKRISPIANARFPFTLLQIGDS